MLSVRYITNHALNLVILLTKLTNNQLLNRAAHPHKLNTYNTIEEPTRKTMDENFNCYRN